jgi:hypothetical protein
VTAIVVIAVNQILALQLTTINKMIQLTDVTEIAATVLIAAIAMATTMTLMLKLTDAMEIAAAVLTVVTVEATRVMMTRQTTTRSNF